MMDLPTRKYVVISTYDNIGYADIEVFETDSILRATRVAKAIADYWRLDLEKFGVKIQKFWTVVVEEPLYRDKERFSWHAEKDGHGNLLSLRPSHSIRRFTDDQDLAMEVD